MKNKKAFKRFKGIVSKHFDRDFYRSKGFQFVWLIAFFVFCWLVCWLFGALNGIGGWRVMELLLDPGCFAGSNELGAAWVQLIVTFVGAVCFTSFLINAVGNWLDQRVERFKQGQVIYEFDDHILILGANDMLINILKSLVAVPDNKKRDIVIQTCGDVEGVRSVIYAEIPESLSRNIYVVFGNRNHGDSLNLLDAFETKAIYILGEENEPFHDATNLECLRLLKSVCEKAVNPINCYMVLNRLSSIQHFYYKSDNGSTDKLHLTVISATENIAQRLLINRDYEPNRLYPALDRDGISADSPVGVHLIVAGMTQMGVAVATTAAHICHFPNFRTKGIRTKITFIQRDIKRDMDLFAGRYRQMLDLSYYRYVNTSNPDQSKDFFPLKEYLPENCDKKGFLDIEWEFIDGGPVCEWVREYLTACAERDGASEYTTLALCENDHDAAVSASLFLPRRIYEKGIPVFVYQPGSGELLRSAKQTDRYANIFPFGTKPDCYDFQYRYRLQCARRIAYLYDLANAGEKFVEMPSPDKLKERWFKLQYAFQQSNLYSANSVQMKLRSISPAGDSLTEEQVEILSETEHNRWNMERLLVGFCGYKYAERMAFKRILESSDTAARNRCKAELDEMKKKRFMHKDIAPYDELSDSTKEYDRIIVRNIPKVLK